MDKQGSAAQRKGDKPYETQCARACVHMCVCTRVYVCVHVCVAESLCGRAKTNITLQIDYTLKNKKKENI